MDIGDNRYSTLFSRNSEGTMIESKSPGFTGKMKKYRWCILAIILLLAVVLILALTLGKSEDGPVPPPVPPTPSGGVYNPYTIDKQTLDTQVSFIKGNLVASQSMLDSLNAYKEQQQNDSIFASPRLIPTGINNPVIMNVTFEIGQADYKVAYIRLTDAQNERYSPPESAVNKPSSQGNMRLDMCGFELLDKPFGFKFTDTRNSNNVILSTEYSALIMMDKYL